jgi:hypothetical protein
MKTILFFIAFLITTNLGNAQTRNVLVGTNNVVTQPTNFWSANAVDARTGLGLGSAATNPASAFQPSSSTLTNLSLNNGVNLTNISSSSLVGAVSIANGGSGAATAGGARTNLGLGWSALTNTNTTDFIAALYGANTNPVLVNSNGSVVNPTNFWQAAPIATLVQLSQPVISATNNATNARNLHLYSLTPSVGGVTNTIILPTNGSTFLGDVAFVIHEGPTNSITAIRQSGALTNLITLNQFQESVKFINEVGGWRLADNISYVEPIYFSGADAASNAAASRTNLGLGATWLTNTNVTNFRTDIELGATNNVTFSNVTASGALNATGVVTAVTNLNVGGAIAVTNAAATRTNLGLGFTALTNTNVAGFQRAIFSTNAAPTNTANVNAINFNTAILWMEVSIVTNSVTNSYRIPLFQ